jgi:preprotein translocase subunit YajC
MRNGISVGDEITTIGGVLGRIVTVKEEYIVIETGSDRNKLRITRWAIQSVNRKADEEGQPKSASFKVKDVKKS